MEGCVSGAGRTGIEAGPEGGARFIAGPEGSGTDAGGTGGGRSVNIWAETAAGIMAASTAASASAGKLLPRPDRPIPLPPRVIAHAFHRKRGKFKPWAGLIGAFRNRKRGPNVPQRPRSSHIRRLAHPQTRHKPCLW